MNGIMREAIELTAVIRASEDWSTEYGKDPKTHARLIKLQAEWEVKLNSAFQTIAKNQANYINWDGYTKQLKADYSVEVLIDENALDDDTSGLFFNISVDLLTEITATGAVAGSSIYNIKTGLTPVSKQIQKLTTDRIGALIGKKILPDGTKVDNYVGGLNISDTMRDQIAQSIKQSLASGLPVAEATKNVRDVISDPYRAEMITRTESVNGYQSGLRAFAKESDAVGKEWQDVGSTDECAENSAAGPIPIDDLFPSGDSEPTAHPNCSCGIRYIHQQEWDDMNGGSDDES